MFVVTVGIAACAFAVFISNSVQERSSAGLSALRSGDGAQMTAFLQSFGHWAPLVSIGLMVGQAIVAPIPGMLIMFANGLAFGVFWGGVVTITGQVLAATACFWIARSLGRSSVEAIVGRFGLGAADSWFDRWGSIGIFVSRLIPGVSFDAVSYLAGLTGLHFGRFVLLTTVGAVPHAFLFAWLVKSSPLIAWLCMGTVMAIMTGGLLVAVIRQCMRPNTISAQ